MKAVRRVILLVVVLTALLAIGAKLPLSDLGCVWGQWQCPPVPPRPEPCTWCPGDPQPDECDNASEGSGDFDPDGYVTLTDVDYCVAYWNTSHPCCDFNCDGVVRLADIMFVLDHTQCETAPCYSPDCEHDGEW